MICKNCGQKIREYDLAYVNLKGPRYVHAEAPNDGWFGCWDEAHMHQTAAPQLTTLEYQMESLKLAFTHFTRPIIHWLRRVDEWLEARAEKVAAINAANEARWGWGRKK